MCRPIRNPIASYQQDCRLFIGATSHRPRILSILIGCMTTDRLRASDSLCQCDNMRHGGVDSEETV
jgi:hypothetical protein